jgi:hypothetical protein
MLSYNIQVHNTFGVFQIECRIQRGIALNSQFQERVFLYIADDANDFKHYCHFVCHISTANLRKKYNPNRYLIICSQQESRHLNISVLFLKINY